MTEMDLATLISDVCNDEGKKKGIEFHRPVAWGAQALGSWEASYRLRRQGHSTVTLSYWFSVHSLLSEEVLLPWAFPPTLKQSEQFKGDVSTTIDQMLEWVKKE
jgi:hypothetical protein